VADDCGTSGRRGVVGAGGMIAITDVNRLTSTDAFCSSCHSMATLAVDANFKQSAHEANAAGLRVGCADCHIPPGNWFAETYDHAAFALRDVFAEYTHDFSDPARWDKRRSELAADVRDELRRTDSATCRKCHDGAAVRPAIEAGRAAHASLQQSGMTCIDCHANRVHGPASRASGPAR
jgi:nitrate/TMAO reductase-like tetraheme cytochrome c subunit